MPDWSYRTIFQPLLFLFPAETGRDLALNAMGRLSRFPFGSTVIDLMGHMRPDRRLCQTEQGLTVSGPVMIGQTVDPHGTATNALARFGVGLVEVGPITAEAVRASRPVELRINERAIGIPAEPAADGIDNWLQRLSQRSDAAETLARLTVTTEANSGEVTTSDCCAMIPRLSPVVNGFVLATSDHAIQSNWAAETWKHHVLRVLECANQLERPVWLAIRADLTPEQLERIVGQAITVGCRGVMIDGRIIDPAGGWIVGPQSLVAVSETVQRLRTAYGNAFSLIAGGVHQPIDAIVLRQQGANCVVVDSGLVFSGPGLPKRINEAVLYADHGHYPETRKHEDRSPIPIQKFTWFWTWIQGAAMLIGGLLALGIASTRVILSYDEVFVGMSRAELDLINPRLLAFMQHDRVTLSGTMFAIATLYLFLSWYGIRRGLHWAMVAVMVSALVGFATFFLFLGFGYFDPFHAFVTTVLFQFSLMAWQGELGKPEFTSLPNLRETPEWRWGQWGQLSFIIHGAVLIAAGTIISGVGCTVVFVQEDLEFMNDVCPADLALANPRLIPLIAHDRASFGGMLIATGIAVLLTALWGFREGVRWQWWMLLLAGIPAYGAAIIVHLAVGYTSLWHLAPAYGGLGLLIAGLSLLYPYMGQRDSTLATEWERLVSMSSGKVSCDSD